MSVLSRRMLGLFLLLSATGCGHSDSTPLADQLPATPTRAPTPRAGSQDIPPVQEDAAEQDVGPELDGGEPDAEGACRRGFAGAVGIVADEAQPPACAVLLATQPLDCVARRTQCVSALQCPDSVWHESQWAFDDAGQAEATLHVAARVVHCTGTLSPEGYDMQWICTVDDSLCHGMIRSYFE